MVISFRTSLRSILKHLGSTGSTGATGATGQLWAVFAFALLLRLLYFRVLVAQVGEERLAAMSTDMKNYYAAANAIASGFDFSHWGVTIFGPGYPSFLAMMGVPFEMSAYAMILGQVIVSSLASVLLAVLAKRLTGSARIGFAVGLINATSLLAIELSCYMWSETLFFALITAATLTQLLGHEKPKNIMLFVISGLLLASAALTRSVGQWLFLAMVPSVLLVYGSGLPVRELLTWNRLRGPVTTVLVTVCLIGLWIGHNYSTIGVAHVAVSAPHGVSKAVKNIRVVSQGISFEEADAAFNEEVQQHRLHPQGFRRALATHARESFISLLIHEPLACIKVLAQNAFKNMTIDTTTEGPPGKMPIISSLSPLFAFPGVNYRSLVLMFFGAVMLWRSRKYRLLGFLSIVLVYFGTLGAFAFDQGSRIFYPAQMAGSILIAYPLVAAFDFVRRLIKRGINAEWTPGTGLQGKWKNTGIALVLALLSVVLVRNAWVCDDAYITLRVIDNVINGHGLTWSTFERVQAYTHPLWMMLVSAVYAITREAYYTIISITILVSMATAGLLALKLAAGRIAACLALFALIACKPFIDFSVSGLENPLSHLLLVVFFLIYFRRASDPKALLLASLVAGLAMLTRMDAVLLYLPPLAYLATRTTISRASKMIALGFLPVVLWELFSLWYYGFLFPNTAYAKLNTSIPHELLIRQGLVYFWNSLYWAPVTLMTISFAGLMLRDRDRFKKVAPGLGILLYLGYVIWVGGDFMSGRFLTMSFLVAVILIARYDFGRWRSPASLTMAAIILTGLVWPFSPVQTGSKFGVGDERLRWFRGISDERAGWYQTTGLLAPKSGSLTPDHAWSRAGDAARSAPPKVILKGGIGLYGYFAGPDALVIDVLALADPLLARLPTVDREKWRIGHFRRNLPDGYRETIQTGINKIENQSLALYYDQLTMITRGDLWSLERCRTILAFNLGSYNYLIEEYLSTPPVINYDQVSAPLTIGTAWDAPECTRLDLRGIQIEMERPTAATRLELSVDHNDDYQISYYRHSNLVATDTVPARWIPERGLRVDTLLIPKTVSEGGFDRLLVVPHGGDQKYSLGHVRLLD